MPLPSKARVYADVNAQKSKDYWDYDSYNIQWGYIHIDCLFRRPAAYITVIYKLIYKLIRAFI